MTANDMRLHAPHVLLKRLLIKTIEIGLNTKSYNFNTRSTYNIQSIIHRQSKHTLFLNKMKINKSKLIYIEITDLLYPTSPGNAVD